MVDGFCELRAYSELVMHNLHLDLLLLTIFMKAYFRNHHPIITPTFFKVSKGYIELVADECFPLSISRFLCNCRGIMP